MRFLSLDPSVNNVGWCLFDSEKKTRKKAWKCGQFDLEGMNYQMRCFNLFEQIEEIINPYNLAPGIDDAPFDILITEWPAFFDNQRGHVAARQNYTIDLAGIVMYIAGRYQLDHRHHFPITAQVWKGSVPKIVTQRRFFSRFKFNTATVTEHVIDAVMLMHYFLERQVTLDSPSLRVRGFDAASLESLL